MAERRKLFEKKERDDHTCGCIGLRNRHYRNFTGSQRRRQRGRSYKAILSEQWLVGDSKTSGGYVTANASQEVYLDSDKIVEKVYVKEGDKVKIGDTLLEYDKTLLELDMEEQQLDKQIKELELKGAQSDLEKLKKITTDTGQ